MALNFPDPGVSQEYTDPISGLTYYWNGSKEVWETDFTPNAAADDRYVKIVGDDVNVQTITGDAGLKTEGLLESEGGVKVSGGNEATVGAGMVYNQSKNSLRLVSYSNPILESNETELKLEGSRGNSGNYAYGCKIKPKYTESGRIYNVSSEIDSNASFSPHSVYNFAAINTSSTITGADHYGFYANSNLGSKGAKNYAFHANLVADDEKNFNFFASGGAPNFYNGDTYIGGTATRNTRELWESTLTEEQKEQLSAGTLAIPANVSTPGDGSFVRQWWYDQQSAEDQALIDSGELDYPEHYQPENFVDTFALGVDTNINLLSTGAVECKSVEIDGGISPTTGFTLFGTNKDRLIARSNGVNVAQFGSSGEVTVGFDGIATNTNALSIRMQGGGTNGGALTNDNAFVNWAARNTGGTLVNMAKFGPVLEGDASGTNNISAKFSFHLNAGGGLIEKAYISSDGMGSFDGGVKVTGGNATSVDTGLYATTNPLGDNIYASVSGNEALVIDRNKHIGIDSVSASSSVVSVGGQSFGSVNGNAIRVESSFADDVTSSCSSMSLVGAVGNAATNYNGVISTFSSGTVENVRGFVADRTLFNNGSVSNIGFLSNLEVGTAGLNYNFYAAGTAPNYFKGDVSSDGTIDGAFSLRMQTDDPAAFQTTYTTDDEGNQVENQEYIGTKEDLLSIIKDLRTRVAALEAA